MDEFIKKSYHTLELDKVLALVSEFASSTPAKEKVLAAEPADNFREADRMQNETAAACEMLRKKGSPSFSGVKDVSALIGRAERGGTLSMGELLDVASLLRAARSARDYRNRDSGDETPLDEYFSFLRPDREFELSITDAILAPDEMADTASSALLTIRRKIKAAQARVREILARVISSQSSSKALQEALITQRSGRFVVPVKAEHKADIPGLVHDVSSSGATVFIEPIAVVEANNEISVLLGEERNEIERILAEFSAGTFERRESLSMSFDMLVSLDVIFAKAKYAAETDAVRPTLNENGRFSLRKARHPLIDRHTVVPIDIVLGVSYTTLIVTGPNTGGKTVTLKTLGLITLMAECGLHIPCDSSSEVALCGAVLADIGDEQSIEQSLSTFSSHMTNIVEILKRADGRTLILFDELGAGTDPVEGAALAIAIIERASKLGAKIAATTHYAELKVYALNTAGVENASCEFSLETLRPTYKLTIGVPGRSNAFAISERLGLEEDVIEHARGLVGKEAGRFEDVIDRLERNRQQMEEERQKAESLRRETEELARRARDREKQYKEERERAAARARAEADAIVSKTRAEAQSLMDELRAVLRRAQSGETTDINAERAEANRKLNVLEDEISPAEKHESDPFLHRMPDRALVKGDRVYLTKIGADGTVLEAADKEGALLVQSGSLKIRTKLADIRMSDAAEKPKPSSKVTFTGASVDNSQAANRLDLRGMSGDEAITEMTAFIDSAVRQRLPEATIIHGKGTGKLRDIVREYLKQHKQVKSFRLGTYGEGDSGVTIVEFV